MYDKKEGCFELLDNMIDDGIDVMSLGVSLRGDAKYKYETVRKRLSRAFGSVNQALVEYGLFEKRGEPVELELHRCFEITGDYLVVENEYKKEDLMDIYNVTETEFKRITKDVRNQCEKEALSMFASDFYPDGFKHHFLRERKLYHLRGYLTRHYGDSFERLANELGMDYRLVERQTYEPLFDLGNTFESIVGEVVEGFYVKKQQRIGDCIPDFVMGETWIDAKLSFGTVFQRSCQTIEKYTKHTDNLTIIYALDKSKRRKVGDVRFIHISEFYPHLESTGQHDLILRIKNFIETAEETKQEHLKEGK